MTSIDEEKIDEVIESIKLEKEIINKIKNSSLEDLENNICKLGFIKQFEKDKTKLFINKNSKYILVLTDNVVHLYEKSMELHHK